MDDDRRNDMEAAAAVAADDAAGPHLPDIPMVDAATPDPATLKPRWRGWIHAVTFPIAIVLGALLVSVAQGAPAKWSSTVFAATSLLLFGVSGLYHRFHWRPGTAVLLKRLDHSNIFLLIAGTYTPMSVLALPQHKAIVLLSIVWSGALLGIGFRVFWINAPRWLYVPLYVALGWAAVMYLGDIAAANVITLLLIIVGGLLYTGGAIVYALKRPNPWPGNFGFHEIFHACTVLAFLCHWTGILLLAIDPVYTA
ncbi:hemolysin III family protein [Okibacterium endophyticum]